MGLFSCICEMSIYDQNTIAAYTFLPSFSHNQYLLFKFFYVHYRAHYTVELKAIEVDGDVLQLPTDIFDVGEKRGTIIDSGTTLAYLPDLVYKEVLAKVCEIV